VEERRVIGIKGRAIVKKKRLFPFSLNWLIEPHPRLVGVENRLGARLFSSLMLVHFALVAVLILIVNFAYWKKTGFTIWDDQDAWTVIAGSVLILAAYALVRFGFFRPGVMLYIAITATVALVAPFLPDPDAELGLLATAIIPVLLTAFVFPLRWVLGVLVAIIITGMIQLQTSGFALRQTGTGYALLVMVLIVGILILIFRRYLNTLEEQRLARIRLGDEAVRESEKKYRNLFETVTDAIFIVDRGGRILEVNEAACRQLGYSRQELLALSLDRISGQPHADISATQQRISDQGHAVYHTTHLRRDGSALPVELAVTAIAFGDNPGFIGVARDLTERQRVEEEKRQLEIQLQQAVKMESIGLLAGGIAHDFNNLLTSILGNAEMAQAALPADSSQAAPLREILKAGNSAAALTRQLLAFSRKQIIQPRLIDLNDLIIQMNTMLFRLIGEHITFKTALGQDLAPVKVDPGLVEQILINLVVNARDAMPDGGTLTVETTGVRLGKKYQALHLANESGKYVMLAVSDDGPGMTAEVKARLFEPFFTTKPKGRGTGLGLATTYGAVKQSGGHIEVYSELGKGTTFKVYFPAASGSVETLEPIETVTPTGDETVLLVEDDPDVRSLSSEMLSSLGYRVIAAAAGAQALEMVTQRKEPIHLLLTDVVLPGMNGRQLAEKLTAVHPETRVLFTSGYTEDIIVHRGVLDQGLSFIGKPYSRDSLAAKIRQILDRSGG
jgi:two-component system, cell cycle sensor histidine kinase and response regulator CckA